MTVHKLVLLRHGESVWNKANIFTGWTDVGLSPKGIEEAKQAGRILKDAGYTFDIVFQSVLSRAIKTTELVLAEMGISQIEIVSTWRLNERHYGALQGLNKFEMAGKVGADQVHIWRRSYGVRPPALAKDDKRYPGNDSVYKGISEKFLPLTESLKDTVDRFLPCWQEQIAPAVRSGKRVLVSAHGNSLRALVKFLDEIPDDEIPAFNIPTGLPIVYELGENLKPLNRFCLDK